jgi:hypothetical protein
LKIRNQNKRNKFKLQKPMATYQKSTQSVDTKTHPKPLQISPSIISIEIDQSSKNYQNRISSVHHIKPPQIKTRRKPPSNRFHTLWNPTKTLNNTTHTSSNMQIQNKKSSKIGCYPNPYGSTTQRSQQHPRFST